MCVRVLDMKATDFPYYESVSVTTDHPNALAEAYSTI